MAVVIESFTENSAVPDSSLVLDKPAGLAVGDLILILVGNDNSTNTDQWDNSTLKPSGFTLINESGTSTSDAHAGAFWKVADAGDVAADDFTVPAQSSNDFWGFCLRLSGVDTDDPINVAGADTNDTSDPYTTNSVNTTVDGCLAFTVLAFDGGDFGTFSTSSSGWSIADQRQAGTGAGNAGGCYATKTVASAGATGACAISSSGNDDGTSSFQFAVAPASIVPAVGSGETFGEGSLAVAGVTVRSGSGQSTAEGSLTAVGLAPVQEYHVFRRTPQTGEPFDPDQDTPLAVVETVEYLDVAPEPDDYDYQVFAFDGTDFSTGSVVVQITVTEPPSGSGSVTGEGSLSATSATVKTGAGETASEGVVAATGATVKSGAGVTTAEGTVEVDGSTDHSGSGTTTGQGALTSTGHVTASGVGETTADALMDAIGQTVRTGAGETTAEGVLSATGAIPPDNPHGAGQSTAVGSLGAVGFTIQSGSGQTISEGSLSANGVTSAAGVGSVSAIGELGAVGYTIRSGLGEIVAEGFLVGSSRRRGVWPKEHDGQTISIGLEPFDTTAISLEPVPVAVDKLEPEGVDV